jgi:hypothetical protein
VFWLVLHSGARLALRADSVGEAGDTGGERLAGLRREIVDVKR